MKKFKSGFDPINDAPKSGHPSNISANTMIKKVLYQGICAVYLFTSSKAPFYLNTNFDDSRTFPCVKCLKLQVRELFDTRKYPLMQYVMQLSLTLD